MNIYSGIFYMSSKSNKKKTATGLNRVGGTVKSLALILEKRQRFNGFNFLVCCGYCYRAHQLYVSALDCLNKKICTQWL